MKVSAHIQHSTDTTQYIGAEYLRAILGTALAGFETSRVRLSDFECHYI
jgi:hypothetical protein